MNQEKLEKSLDLLGDYFSICRRILGNEAWDRILSALENTDPWTFVCHIEHLRETNKIADYIPDIALVEFKYQKCVQDPVKFPESVTALTINPSLLLIPVGWKHLPVPGRNTDDCKLKNPEKTDSFIIMWKNPETREHLCREADDDDLLAVKLVVEDIDIHEATRRGNTTLAKIQAVLHRAAKQGILISPDSRICRDFQIFPTGEGFDSFLKTDVFTLQWHITQACDLHCRHCYDRSDRTRLSFSEAERVLDDLFEFTQTMHVMGHVTFTGGNPLLYPHLEQLYQSAADRGFSIAILGNPTTSEILDALLGIHPLTHYQISLEGLQPYNDYIRGPGHFNRSLKFLDLLRKKNIYSMVMLTLNRDNMDQVLPLAEILNGKADSFTFNRLAMVGEGKNLDLPDPDKFKSFLKDYLTTVSSNPFLRLKDNLFNIIKTEAHQDLFGGCTGHGCGAAFNFVSLLPDGEVHACRKFPSRIGSVLDASFLEIYNSQVAARYRKGSAACSGCDLFTVCRGCPAVVFGMGLDNFKSRDPFCFYDKAPGQTKQNDNN